MIRTKLVRGVCERSAWCLATVHKKAHTLVWQYACGRQQSRQIHKPAQHTLHPHNQASPSPTAAQDSRFQPPASCWRAHTVQHSQLAGCSHSWRARRPGTTRRPRAGPFPHPMATPLHFYTLALGPWSPLARPSPQTREEAPPWPASPASRPRKRRENPASGANRHRRLRRPAPDTPSKLFNQLLL